MGKRERRALFLMLVGALFSATFVPGFVVVGGAGLALGAQDLQPRLGKRAWYVAARSAGWAASALGVAIVFGLPLVSVWSWTLLVALFASATVVARVAQRLGRERLARALSLLRCVWIAFVPLFLVSPAAALLVHVASCLVFAVLVHRVRVHAVPYGRRVALG